MYFIRSLVTIITCLGSTCARKEVEFGRFNTTSDYSSERALCMRSVITDDTLIGARINSDDKTCEPLQFSWYDDTAFEHGYEYLIKVVSREYFDQPVSRLVY